MEGTVQISIKDFDNLRLQAKMFNELRNTLRTCTEVDYIKNSGDEDTQIIRVDVKKAVDIALEFADVESRFDNDEIQLLNIDEL